MFGINGTEAIILIIVALVVIGPKRMPEYAQRLRELVRQVRDFALSARAAMNDEFGDEFKDVDWQKLDPRQYDPRRIVKEALAEDAPAAPAGQSRNGQNTTQPGTQNTAGTGQQDTPAGPSPFERYSAQTKLRDTSRGAPFDPEST